MWKCENAENGRISRYIFNWEYDRTKSLAWFNSAAFLSWGKGERDRFENVPHVISWEQAASATRILTTRSKC